MKKFLIFIMFFYVMSQINLLLFLAPILSMSQNICLKSTPDSSFKVYFDALICGKSMPANDLRDLFLRMGLIHLMIVSGAHLHLLAWFAKNILKLQQTNPFLILFFILYTFFTGFHPLVVRVLAAMLLHLLSQKLKWSWDNLTVQIYSGFFCLMIIPVWTSSTSLQFSWLAGLALSTSLFFANTDRVTKSLAVGLILQILIFMPLGQMSPLVLVFNFFINPVFFFFILPLSLLTFCFHFFTPLFDVIFSFFIKALTILAEPATAPEADHPLGIFNYWIYLFLWIFILHFLRVFYRRRQT